MTLPDPTSLHREDPDARTGERNLTSHEQASTVRLRTSPHRGRIKALIWRAVLGAASAAGASAITLLAKWAITVV